MYEEKSDFDFQVGNEFVLFNGKIGKLTYKYYNTFSLKVDDKLHLYDVSDYGSKTVHKDYAIMGMVPSKNKDDDPLPEWALTKSNKNKIEQGTQLFTKNGAVTGNAAVFYIYYDVKYKEPIFCVITDAGNISKYTINELLDLFTIGDYIMKTYIADPNEVKIDQWLLDHFND